MDLEARKYEFIQKLFTVNETLFEKLENIINKESNEYQSIGLEQYNKEIDDSIAQIKKGEYYTHQEVKAHIKKWRE